MIRIKQKLFLKYQKLKSSNKHGLTSFDSQSTLCILENKAILLTDGTTEETHQLQDFCNIFIDLSATFYITPS